MKTFRLALLAGLTMLMTVPVAAQTLRLATVVNAPHPWVDAAELFKAEVEANTDLTVQIFPGGQLGNDATVVDEMRIGTVDVMIGSVGNVAPFLRSFEFFSMNYLFEDMDEFRAVTDPDSVFFTWYAEQVADAGIGLQLLALTGGGTRNLSTARGPVAEPSDLEGVRMRTTGAQLDQRMWQAMGAVTTSLPWTELYTGVQTGVVEAFESTISGYYGSRLYEVAPYHALTGHQIMMSHLSMSSIAWNRLSDADRAAVTEAARLAGAHGTERGVYYDGEVLARFADLGVTVTEVDVPAFAARVADLHDEVAEGLGVSHLLQALRDLR